MEGNGLKKISFKKVLLLQTELTACFPPRHASVVVVVVVSSPEWFGTELQLFAYILFHGTEFRAVFSFAEWIRTKFREFASNGPWYRIPSIFLLCRTVPNGILRIFCSAEQPEYRRNKPIVPSIPSSAE
jgi:hypothetical protein